MDARFGADVTAKLQSFVEQTSDFLGVGDPWGRILYLNPAACKRIGVADYSDLTLADIFPAEAFAFYYEVVRPELLRTGAWSGEVLVNTAGVGAAPMYISATAELGPGGETNGGVVLFRDLPPAPSVALGGEGAFAVGGPLEWSVFEERVSAELAAANRGGDVCALVLATVGMGETIERFGTLSTTSVLRALAGRLGRIARSIDVVGLNDRDYQLGILLRGMRSHNEALRIAGAAYESLVEAPVTSPSGQITPPIECGVALGQPGDDPAAFFPRAAVPVWPAADAPSDVDIDVDPGWSPTMHEFRVGMSHGDVRPHAQPVVELTSGVVVGYRGLARWEHPRLGLLDTPAFVPMIAETPLANEVDLYVARETAAMLTLIARENTRLRLYFPASRRLVADVRTEQFLWEISDAFSIRTQHMCVQVGRPLLDDWTPAMQDALQSLAELGVTLVATDVGEAADVRPLAALGFDEVHLADRVVHAAASDGRARSAVAEIVRLAHDGGLLVAAAGVDRATHRDALLETGCDLATGDLFGEPRPTDTIE